MARQVFPRRVTVRPTDCSEMGRVENTPGFVVTLPRERWENLRAVAEAGNLTDCETGRPCRTPEAVLRTWIVSSTDAMLGDTELLEPAAAE